MSDLVQIVSTLGFPIACCIAMGYFFKYITDKDREERQALSNQHREEMLNLSNQHREDMSNVSTAINNNTIALTKLCERLDADDN